MNKFKMQPSSKIYVAGHNGMVGSAIIRVLVDNGYTNLITRSRAELDLCNSKQVADFYSANKPEYVFLAAARVGGIQANINSPAEFLYENVMIQTNVIHEAYKNGVKKLLALGSSCIYPKETPQPMKEEYLLTGKLEPTNEAYALSKILALKQAEYYYRQYGFQAISVMPPNLYGPNDSFDLEKSHVLSALVRRFADAVESQVESVTLWGTGIARREFMHVDDLASGLLFLMDNYNLAEFINIGVGSDISIKDLAYLIADKAGYKGKILWDDSKPNGMLRKCMDISRITSLGFKPKISLEQGIESMLNDYRKIQSVKSI